MKNVTKGVQVWEEELVIPTYGVGKPDPNPMFLEKRVYQGSSGKVYPHSVIDKIYDECHDKVYKALCLENAYLFVVVLPELGGRIQRALDKTNGYDFVYYNHVIKPALVGLTGPWISGGIEFNWPQHHRPSTFDPVDYRISENPDGSCTIDVGEIENMFRTKGMASFTLYPDKAYIQVHGQLYNRTSLPQTFLWWANPAVPANEHTQSIFPPDVQAVMDHGKRDVSAFPIARGVYYKQDFTAGVDISRYKNIKVPMSYMVAHSDYDFVGGYDYGKQAGILHVADHHISPGKKQWTWGSGEFGKAWDRNLTDEDGPYIELMTGCFTDNQPDFSWMAPYEEKTFVQYFMPYRGVGQVKNATVDCAVGLEKQEGKLRIAVYASGVFPNAEIRVSCGSKPVFAQRTDLSPQKAFEALVDSAEKVLCAVEVKDLSGRVLVRYEEKTEKNNRLPEAAKVPPMPWDVRTNEDLYLYGLHLEQYRHATWLAEDYYQEGLKRDPTDVRINTAYGLLLMRRGLFREAEEHFTAAIQKWTRSNPNPYDGESWYFRGVCRKLRGDLAGAYGDLYKSTWNGAWQEGAFYQMACIQTLAGEPQTALSHVERALVRNRHHMKARALKAALLRGMDREEEACAVDRESLAIDPLDLAASYGLGGVSRRNLLGKLQTNHNWAIELALEYMEAGFFRDAAEILDAVAGQAKTVYPMVYYHLADAYARLEQEDKAKESLALAAQADSCCCFPHRLEDMLALEWATGKNPQDGLAWYYLGNLYYDKRRYQEAAKCWESTTKRRPSFPTAHRNLALAYYNKLNRPREALAAMEVAFACEPGDARVYMELDQLKKKLSISPEERLTDLEEHLDLVEQRDDLYLEYVMLLNVLRQPKKALEWMEKRKFHPWEGGEGRAPAQYTCALVELARKALEQERYNEVVTLLERALQYPENLGEGKLVDAQENNIHYFLGLAYRGLGEEDTAMTYLGKASDGLSNPAGMMYYNDQPPEMIFYQGLAKRALGDEAAAQERFDNLLRYAEQHMEEEQKIEYFAISLPELMIFDENLKKRHIAHCLFMKGLGHLGKGERDQAIKAFDQVSSLYPEHLGVSIHREFSAWALGKAEA